MVDALAGRTLGRPSAIAATVVTEPARPTRVRASRQRHRLLRASRAPPRCRRARPRPRRPSAGRRAGAARSAARSRCRPTRGRAAGVRRRARTRSSRRRCRRPGTAPGAVPRSSRVAPAKDSAASSSPVTTSGSTPSALADAADELVAVRGVAGGRGRDEPHPLGARARAITRGVASAARRRCAPAPRGRAGRCGRRPARAGRSPSAGRRRAACRPPASTSATSSRIEFVPQSIAATRVTSAPPPRRPATQAPPAHQSRQQRERLVAERVDARARRPASAPTSTCRHFTRSGMPPAETPVDLRHLAERVARGRGSPRARPGSAAASSGSLASRSVISRIRPSASSVPIGDAARGQVGSTASGTACRRAAAARSRPRPASRTGSGARPRATPRGGRPSCSATTARSTSVGVASLRAVARRLVAQVGVHSSCVCDGPVDRC